MSARSSLTRSVSHFLLDALKKSWCKSDILCALLPFDKIFCTPKRAFMEPDISLFSIPSQLFLASYHAMSTYIDSKSEGNASVEMEQYTQRILNVCSLFTLKL